MKYKFDLKWLLIIGLAIALIVSLKACHDTKKDITQLQIDNQVLDSTKNLYGQTILTQEAIVTENKQAIKDLTDSIFNLTNRQDRQIKDVIAYYKGITTITIKEKLVPYIDAVGRKKWQDSVLASQCKAVIDYYEDNYIYVPTVAKDTTNKNYKATLTAQKDGIKINDITIPDSQYIRFATIKGGLLKKDAAGKRHLFTKQSIQVQVFHTNELIKVTGQNSAIYIAPKKARILEKVLFTGAGILLGTKL